MTQAEVFVAAKNREIRAICERYTWRFLVGHENVTRQVRSLEKQDKIKISYYPNLNASVEANG